MKFFLSLVLMLFAAQLSAKADPKHWAPDFLIVGAQKAGTTALHHFLLQHPEIVKQRGEVHFFDERFGKGAKWYQRRFPSDQNPNHLICDKSPYYLMHPTVPQRVHSLYPNVKILIVLRNPVDRAYSQFWMNKRSATKEPFATFEEAIDAEKNRLKGEEKKISNNPLYPCRTHRIYSYLGRGVYVKQIKRWLALFPREQIFIVDSNKLRNQPEDTMSQIFGFLGLPDCSLIQFRDKHSKYPPMNPETRKRLSDYFRPYNQELEELLGMKFNWN